LRQQRSNLAAVLCALFAGGGAALLFVSFPAGYAQQSLLHQVVPFQTGLALSVRLWRLGSWAPWVVAAAFALVAVLATTRFADRRRAGARLAAAALATILLAGTALAALGEVAFESKGSLLHHSSAAATVRHARNQGRLDSVAVDAELPPAHATSAEAILRWKDSLRVIADLPELALAARPTPGNCAAVLTTSRLPDREIVAAFYSDTLFLWGPRPGFHCEPEAEAPAD